MKIELNIKLTDFITAQFVIVTSILLLGILSYIFPYITGHGLLGFLRLFDVGNEVSIPTYFSTFNMLLSSLLIFLIYKNEKMSNRKGANYWWFLAVVLLFLSIDEGSRIHERFKNVVINLENHGIIPPLLETHKWLPYGVLFALVMGLIFFPFIKSLPSHTALYFTIAGLIFITGAIGIEFVGSLMLKAGYTRSDLIYKLRRILEEGFEMYGIAIFNCALYREICNKKITAILNNTRTYSTHIS